MKIFSGIQSFHTAPPWVDNCWKLSSKRRWLIQKTSNQWILVPSHNLRERKNIINDFFWKKSLTIIVVFKYCPRILICTFLNCEMNIDFLVFFKTVFKQTATKWYFDKFYRNWKGHGGLPSCPRVIVNFPLINLAYLTISKQIHAIWF